MNHKPLSPPSPKSPNKKKERQKAKKNNKKRNFRNEHTQLTPQLTKKSHSPLYFPEDSPRPPRPHFLLYSKKQGKYKSII